MTAKPVVLAIALFSSTLAIAGTTAIGTANASGQMQVDGYTVRDSATLFDGSTVETSEVGAMLRLEKGTEIKLAVDSRGTFFRDRLVLSRGETELTTSIPFQLQAEGISVVPAAPHTTGVVSLSPEHTVEVAALAGELRVTSSHGVLLANVMPGAAMSFSAEPGAAAAPAADYSDIGLVSSENGHYYLTSTINGTKYEITGKNLSKYVGKKVVINGSLQSGTASAPTSVAVSSIAINGAAGISTLSGVLIGTSVAGGAAVVGYAASSSASP